MAEIKVGAPKFRRRASIQSEAQGDTPGFRKRAKHRSIARGKKWAQEFKEILKARKNV